MSIEFEDEQLITTNVMAHKESFEPKMVQFLMRRKIVKNADQAYILLLVSVIVFLVVAGFVFAHLYFSSSNSSQPKVDPNVLPSALRHQLQATGQLTS